MSLEDQVARLANAVAMHDDVAVREIIRQRDKAFSDLSAMTSNRDYYERLTTSHSSRREALERRNVALRGVITRMKKRESK